MPDWRGLSVFSRSAVSRGDEAVEYLKRFMADCEADRLTLLTIVTQPREKFVNILRAEAKGLAIDDAMIDLVWQWLNARKGVNPEVEREWLEIDRRDQAWKQQRIVAEMEKLATAAKYNLRTKGDQLFDGEKVTIGEDDPRL